MRRFTDWFRRRPGAAASDRDQSPPSVQGAAPAAAPNPATHASAGELILLQRHAAKISLTPRQPARARLGGNHASRVHGRGMDYQESRIYQPGDDIRNIDWRVTARTGKPHTKLYEEERERPVILFLDLNPGMFFGTRGSFKSVAAARAAALIAWAAAAHGDRVGGLLFNGGHCELPPRGGRHGVLRLIRELTLRTDPRLAQDASHAQGSLNQALARLRRISRPGSLIFLLSDFYGIDEESGHHLLRLAHQCDLSAIQVVDPLELAPPPAARYGVTDGHGTGVLDTRRQSVREAYQDYFHRHHETVAETMRSRGIPLLRLSTQDDVAARLGQHFAPPGHAPSTVKAAA